MEDFNLLFNVITLVAGIYCLYTWFKLRSKKHLFDNQLLVPKDSRPSECIDEESYIKFISLRLVILGVICTLTSILCILDMEYGLISNLVAVENFGSKLDLACNGLCMAALIWYMISWTKGRKEYWV